MICEKDDIDYRELAERFVKTLSRAPQAKAERQLLQRIRGQTSVLSYLAANNNRAYPKDLSEGMMVSTARVTVILGRLEREGVITRSADPNDRRQVIVALTEKGAALAEKYRSETISDIVKTFEYLGAHDAEEYVRICGKILQMPTNT